MVLINPILIRELLYFLETMYELKDYITDNEMKIKFLNEYNLLITTIKFLNYKYGRLFPTSRKKTNSSKILLSSSDIVDSCYNMYTILNDSADSAYIEKLDDCTDFLFNQLLFNQIIIPLNKKKNKTTE